MNIRCICSLKQYVGARRVSREKADIVLTPRTQYSENPRRGTPLEVAATHDHLQVPTEA